MNKLLIPLKWILQKRSRTILAVLILITAIIFVTTRTRSTQKEEYQTVQVEKGTIVSTVSASGSILTANILPISTSATGLVTNVLVKDGQLVDKGEKIAEIELDSASEEQYVSARASYQSALISLANAKNSLRSAIASADKTLDEVKGNDTNESFTIRETRTKAEVSRDAAYNAVTQAEIQVAKALIDYQQSSGTITAPSTGRIDYVTIVKGMSLSTSTSSTQSISRQRIAVIKIEANPLATFTVSEIDVSKVAQGQKATITVDSLSDKTFTGKVVSVDKIGSITSGVTSYPIVIQFDTKTEGLLPNMSVTANIILDTKNDVFTIPTSAVSTSNEQSTVRVLKDGNEQVVVVETGLTSDSGVEIVSGLSEGDVVITGTAQSGVTTDGQSQSPFSSFGGGTFRGAAGGQVRVVR